MPVKKPHQIPQDEEIDLEDLSVHEFVQIHGQRYLVFDDDPHSIAHCVVFGNDPLIYLEYMLDRKATELGYSRRIIAHIRGMDRFALDELARNLLVYQQVVEGKKRGVTIR